MSVNRIHLYKLLRLMFLPDGKRRSELRKDIRSEIARAAGLDSGGPDFYMPFWADARSHVVGTGDLTSSVEARVAANPRRKALFPRLHDGFLQWWDERRRWTNEPFQIGQSLKSHVDFDALNATVKIESVMSVKDAQGVEHYVYPYFFPDPVLSTDASRLGLWLLTSALPQVPAVEIRILDIVRGQTFSVDRFPLIGNEEDEFVQRYSSLIREREILMREYN